MPTTRYSLAILCLIAFSGLSGCNGSMPARSATDSTQSPGDDPEESDVARAEQTWLQDWNLPDAFDALPSGQFWLQNRNLPETTSTTKIDSLAEVDLWTRIRHGFELTLEDESRIAGQLEWYHDHPDHLPQIEERARPYLFYIVEELDRRGLPMELALLPAIESAFIPTAYSSQNAAGIWQFMPSTGKMLGLEQNSWYDGRLDVVAATEAALDYLQSLAAQFDGDWNLALAAYNSGEGTVRRAMQKNREQGKSTDFWSLDLPWQTRRYVPQLLALAKVVEEPEAFGTRLTSIPNQPLFDSVDIQAQLDLTLAARMAELSIDELLQLNPAFNRWATAPQGPHRLILPLENIEMFKQNLVALDPKKRLRVTAINRTGNSPTLRYTIQPGDNLGSIARRHGTTVDTLKLANGLEGNMIRAGRHLLIPGPVPETSRPLPVVAQRQRQVGISGRKTIYTVRSGDSLWAIARSYNVDHEALARWNGIAAGDTLQPGQKLIILNDSVVAEAAAAITAETAVR